MRESGMGRGPATEGECGARENFVECLWAFFSSFFPASFFNYYYFHSKEAS